MFCYILANLLWAAFLSPFATKDVKLGEETLAIEDIRPEEIAGLFEGDILGNPYMTRNGFFKETWPGGVVPYSIDFDYPIEELAVLDVAIARIHRKTCIRFRRKIDEDKDWLSIVGDKSGCFSYVGKIGGKQILSLQTKGCLYAAGTPEHELIHALGFTHEQNRFDRDDYVTVMWENIQKGNEYNFQKVLPNVTSSYGVPYDYRSVMHYSAYSFSKNNQPTLLPKKENVTLGQREDLSEGDIKKINTMYNCSLSM